VPVKQLIFLLLLPGLAFPQTCNDTPRTEIGQRFQVALPFRSADRFIRIQRPGTRYLQARIQLEKPVDCRWRITLRDTDGHSVQVLENSDFKNSPSRWTSRVYSSTLYFQFDDCPNGEQPQVSVREYIAMPEKAEHPYYSLQIDNQEQFKDLYSDAVPMDVKKLGDAVAFLTISWDRETWACSGVMLTPELLLTNWHCGGPPEMNGDFFWNEQILKEMQIDFSWDGDTISWDYTPLKLMAKNKELDYALIQIESSSVIGRALPAVISRSPLQDGADIKIIHHPAGRIKQISSQCTLERHVYPGWQQANKNTEFTHLCDTESGSSGAPVFDSNGFLIGLHHLGFDRKKDCSAIDRKNKAVAINEILSDIAASANPELRKLLANITFAPVTQTASLARVSGFSVHTERKAFAAALSVPCTESTGSDSCPPARKVATTILEVTPAQATAALTTTSVLPSEAFERAYQLRGLYNSDRVEPNFEYTPPAQAAAMAAQCPAGSVTWAHEYIRLGQAWKFLQGEDIADGREGDGIVIAHLDTGYTKHPEIYNDDEDKSPVLYKHGYNYVEDNDSPVDPFSQFTLLPNPGHGTKSGSVIASPKGKQGSAGRPAEFVDGVAPAARLIPVRVHKSVVNIFPFALSRAIWDAVDDRTKIKSDSQIISIAMGGPPTWGLWKAVRHAQAKGVIVVAAAGNNVGFVVWPARFKEVISATALNANCALWSGASKGKVDITAPGEVIEHAVTDEKGNFSYGTGCGTTYATGHTSGAAALWLQHLSKTQPDMLKQLKDSGQLTDVFRNALAQSAWLPSQAPSGITCTTTLWDKSKSGPGILNTEALLKVHLPPLVSALVSTGVEPDLPLFQSLVPSLSNSETIKLYVDLLGIPENKASEYFFLESEIMFHYTNNDDLRHAVDTYLSRPDTVTAASARSALISVSSPTLRKLILGPQSE
jgi:subtilisin family serine protease/V8-like Glu-specific endopeptidase